MCSLAPNLECAQSFPIAQFLCLCSIQPGVYRYHSRDRCFCEACMEKRGDKDSYPRGARGSRETYYLPKGWAKFALR